MIAALKQVEAGRATEDVAREYGVSKHTMYAWRAGGVSLAHSSQSQYSETTHIPISAVQAGDLLFYYSDIHHVAMYVGGGMMVEAPHTGADVREVPMRLDSLVGAGRPG